MNQFDQLTQFEDSFPPFPLMEKVEPIPIAIGTRQFDKIILITDHSAGELPVWEKLSCDHNLKDSDSFMPTVVPRCIFC